MSDKKLLTANEMAFSVRFNVLVVLQEFLNESGVAEPFRNTTVLDRVASLNCVVIVGGHIHELSGAIVDRNQHRIELDERRLVVVVGAVGNGQIARGHHWRHWYTYQTQHRYFTLNPNVKNNIKKQNSISTSAQRHCMKSCRAYNL